MGAATAEDVLKAVAAQQALPVPLRRGAALDAPRAQGAVAPVPAPGRRLPDRGRGHHGHGGDGGSHRSPAARRAPADPAARDPTLRGAGARHPGGHRAGLRRQHRAPEDRGGHGHGRRSPGRPRGRRRSPARHGLRGAGGAPGQSPDRGRARRRRLRHPHRALRGQPAGALPRRRAALRPGVAAAAAAGRAHLAHQDHGRDEHRGAAPAPGRAHPGHRARRPARGHPRLHRAHHPRRVHRHAAAGPLLGLPALRPARLRAGARPAASRG